MISCRTIYKTNGKSENGQKEVSREWSHLEILIHVLLKVWLLKQKAGSKWMLMSMRVDLSQLVNH